MYRDLAQYIVERLSAVGETPTSMAQRLGWGDAYLHNIIHGQFKPSSKRCIELAEALGDDPNIILALAEHYVPPQSSHQDYLTLLNSLESKYKEYAIDYLCYLKWKQDNEQ